MLAKLRKVSQDAESAEKVLSYNSRCGSEHSRKLSGSYYTPVDVSSYFWNEFFNLTGLKTVADTLAFIRNHSFVEPSVGAGVLFFSFLEKLVAMGLTPKNLAEVEVILVDINELSLEFVKARVNELGRSIGAEFVKIAYVCADFRDITYPKSSTPLVFFGNPPFVTNRKGTSVWRNLFADFLEISLNAAGAHGSVHYILPLSIAFSQDYSKLRRKIHEYPRMIGASHFDNIPDGLFKTGKPKHYNSNRANSQRCSILHVIHSENTQIFSTKLHRWSRNEREKVLNCSPRYFNVTDYCFNDQIPRPKHEFLLNYLDQSKCATTLGKLLTPDGKFLLHVGSVARNYIGIRESVLPGTHKLRFDRSDDFYRVLLVVSSDLFYDYWLTVGDGFHVTKKNLHNFPVHDALLALLTTKLNTVQEIWKNRRHYAKKKVNSGVEIRSFDFSDAFPSVYMDLKLVELHRHDNNSCSHHEVTEVHD